MKRAIFFLFIAAILGFAATLAYATLDEGATLFGQGKYDQAVEVLKKEIADHPTNAKAYMFLASCYEKLDQWKEAADAWDKFGKLTDSADEKAYAEKHAKDARDRASGKTPAETPEPVRRDPNDGSRAKGPDPNEDYSKYQKQEDTFFTTKTEHFVIMAKNRELLARIASESERHLQRIRDIFLFGRAWPHMVTIRCFKDHADYIKEAGMPDWSGGGYSVREDGAGGLLRAVDLYALDPEGNFDGIFLFRTIPHELTHLVIHEYFGERTFQTLPRALNEGLAMYSEEGTETIYQRELADAVKKGVYFKLTELYGMKDYPKNVPFFYAESASATRYLVEHLKADQFETFLAALKKGETVNSALQTALGRTGDLLEGMESNWVQMLKDKADEYAKNPPPDDSKGKTGKGKTDTGKDKTGKGKGKGKGKTNPPKPDTTKADNPPKDDKTDTKPDTKKDDKTDTKKDDKKDNGDDVIEEWKDPAEKGK